MLVKYLTSEVENRCPLRPAREGDAGYDLCNASNAQIVVPVGRVVRVPAGVSVKIPLGCVGFIKARSSTFVKHGLFVIEGVIDSGYTGPLYSMVWVPGLVEDRIKPHTLAPAIIEPWQRVAQLIVCRVDEGGVDAVKNLPLTERGEQGFGSTGV